MAARLSSIARCDVLAGWQYIAVKSRNAMTKSSVAPCPCGGSDYANCCKPYHDGTEPPSADRLMRARYSAYVLGLMPYVHATWHASTRPPLSDLTHDAAIKWLGLEIRKHVPQQDEATVEFVARSKSAGRAHRLHEISRFVREDRRWLYINGVFPE
jgi:SEC-C motif-containing protein